MNDRADRALRWSFSTLGCPEKSLADVFALARQFGLAHVELRALEGTVELPALFARQFGEPASLAKTVKEAGIGIASLDTSFRVIDGDAAARDALLAFIPWAEALGGVPLRVFDGGKVFDDAALAAARATFAWWDAQCSAGGWKSTLIVETHDCAVDAASIGRLFADAPASVGLLWDSHHTWKKGGEDPLVTWPAVKKWTRHVHVKDSVSRPSTRHPFTYVDLGTGEFPLKQVIDRLRDDRFSGTVSIEWERMWHPYLQTLERALDDACTGGFLC